MPLQRVSLKSFLQGAKAALSKGPQPNSPLTFVIGNESAGKSNLPLSSIPKT